MFGLGIGEIFTILLVAVIFINPKDMPKIARKLGYIYSKIKKAKKNLDDKVDEIFREADLNDEREFNNNRNSDDQNEL